MLVCKERPATYSYMHRAYPVFSGFAFVKWFYFWKESINLYYIRFRNNEKPDYSKILLYSFLQSPVDHFFKTYQSLFDYVLRVWTQSKSHPSRNFSEKQEWQRQEARATVCGAKVRMPEKARNKKQLAGSDLKFSAAGVKHGTGRKRSPMGLKPH